MKKIIFALSLMLLLQNSPAEAAVVAAAKNQKVIVNLEGSDVSEGDEFFLINPNNHKKTAIIRIKQVKANKALADVLRGTADVGYTLEAKAPSEMPARNQENNSSSRTDSDSSEKSQEKSSAHLSRDTGYLRTLKESYGALGEYAMNSMSVSVKNTNVTPALTDSVALKGTSFGAGGFYDYLATNDIVVQVAGFLEQYQASGTSTIPGCAGATSTACDVNITYLSGYGTLKYYFLQNRYRFWAGGGGGFLLALSKSATAVNESQISTNQILTFSAGMDIQMSRKNYIPIVLQYNYYPPSDTVKATSIVLKAGWAWNFK